MIRLSPTSWLAIAVVALVQTGLLATILYGRVTLLRDGREIVVEVIPVDPRDLFRGDYVILGYDFTRPANVPIPEGTVVGDTLYVTLRPTGPEQWEVAGAASTTLAAPADPSDVVLRGTVSHISRPPGQEPRASVRYGIESYFVPEGTGLELERQVAEKKISAVLAVGKSGEVAIKALQVDGQRLAEQPLL